MSVRLFVLGIAMLASWAIDVNPLAAQTVEKPRKKDKLVRVVYPIVDLLVPIVGHIADQRVPIVFQSVFEDRKPAKDAPTPTRDELASKLMQAITSHVVKNSWESVGGRGSIQYFPFEKAVVVHQTKDVQEEIELLLACLRRLCGVQVAVDVRFIEVSSETAEHLLSVMTKHCQPIRDRAVAVDDKRLLSLLEVAQADRLGVVRQAPKFTLLNSQKGAVNAMLDRVGFRFDVSGVVSADRKTVRLWLDFEDGMTTTRAIRSAETFNVPANRTLIWPAGEVGGTHVFVIATPRIMIAEEQERIFLGELPPIPGR